MRKLWTALMITAALAGTLLGAGRAEAESTCNTGTRDNFIDCLRNRVKFDKNGNIYFWATNVYVTSGDIDGDGTLDTVAELDALYVDMTDVNHVRGSGGGYSDKDYSLYGGMICDTNSTEQFQPCDHNDDCTGGDCVDNNPAGTCDNATDGWSACSHNDDCANGDCDPLVNVGLGNLIMGKAETTTQPAHKLDTRTGNDNLIVGDGHHFMSDRGVVFGLENHIRGSSDNSTVLGGQWNHVKGETNVIVGGFQNYTAAEQCTAGWTQGVCHYPGNSDCDIKTCGGGAGGAVCVSNDDCTSPTTCSTYSAGTCGSTAPPTTKWSVVVGGSLNGANDLYSVVMGGAINNTQESWSAIGGGYFNDASGKYSYVGGGNSNLASGESSSVNGGVENTASGGASSVSGGYRNGASANFASVAGGQSNTASDSYAAILGGNGNTASEVDSAVLGGYGNEASGSASAVCGGWSNTASGSQAAVSGGTAAVASGSYSVVVGGDSNTASGQSSVAVSGSYNDADGAQSCVVGGGGSGTGNTNGGYTGAVIIGESSKSNSANYKAEPSSH